MAASQFPTPPPYYFDESVGDSTKVTFVRNGIVYFVLPNGVGASGPPPGGTYQLFIQKSADNGATRTDITPGSPTVDMTGMQFENFVVAGDILYVLYHPGGDSNKVAWARFDLINEVWLADSAQLSNGGEPIEQSVYRAFDNVIFCGIHSNNDGFAYIRTYDIAGDTWSANTQVSSSSFFRNLAIGVDSNDLVHIFYAEGLLGGQHNLVHLSFNTNNSENTKQTLVTSFNNPGAGVGFPDNGQPVFYLDVTPNVRKIAIPVVTRSANSATDVGVLNLFIGDESANPTWVQTAVPTSEPVDVTFVNTFVSATAAPIAALLPIERSTATDLYIFWTTSGVRLVPLGTDFDNFMRWMTLTDGVFSAITTDYQELSNQLVPGPIYPLLLAQSGDTATIGVFFPVIDQLQFTSLATKYESLSLWFDLPLGAPAPTISYPDEDCIVGVPCSATPTVSGGTPPYSFSSATLPPGFGINPTTGVISGTPTTPGTFSVTVTVTDSLSATASTTFTMTIATTAQIVRIFDGGGGGWECRVTQCVPKKKPCPDWGPVKIVKDRRLYRALYRDSHGNIRDWPIDPNQDPVLQVVATVMRIERPYADPRLNNPGRLPFGDMQIAEVNGIAVFPDLAIGIENLKQAVVVQLLQGRREVL